MNFILLIKQDTTFKMQYQHHMLHFLIINGSPDREAAGQVSQTIQFDEIFARELVRILRDEYDIN
jgi:hypothetical protein